MSDDARALAIVAALGVTVSFAVTGATLLSTDPPPYTFAPPDCGPSPVEQAAAQHAFNTVACFAVAGVAAGTAAMLARRPPRREPPRVQPAAPIGPPYPDLAEYFP